MVQTPDHPGVLLSNEKSGGFAKIIEDLEWKLQRELQNSDWWWNKCWELEEQLQTQVLRVTSPLTRHTEWGGTPRQQGHLWSWYTVSCPCCKRPLDVTMMRKDTESQVATSIPVLEQCEERQVHVVATSSEGDGLPVRKTTDTFESLDTAAGPIEMVKRVYPIVSVQPQGAVDGRWLQLPSSAASELTVCGSSAQANAQTKAPRLQVECHQSRYVAATPASPRYAYCAVIWGANVGYTLGALVLGARLKELSVGKVQHDRILLHTDDVPSNFVSALKKVWTMVRQVDYIDAVDTMYIQKGGGGGLGWGPPPPRHPHRPPGRALSCGSGVVGLALLAGLAKAACMLRCTAPTHAVYRAESRAYRLGLSSILRLRCGTFDGAAVPRWKVESRFPHRSLQVPISVSRCCSQKAMPKVPLSKSRIWCCTVPR